MTSARKKQSRGADAERKGPTTKGPAIGRKQRRSILAIDIGGSGVKLLASGQTEPRRMKSGSELTPARMIEGVRKLTRDWSYEAVSIGYPGLLGPDGPRSEPGNLGNGWVGFNFAAAFKMPVRMINDAAMHALGSYEGGRMLFLGLGTGLGSTLVSENVIIPLELGCLPIRRRSTLGDLLGRQGLKKTGKAAWRRMLSEVIPQLASAFTVDSIVLGGGNARHLRDLPAGVRLVNNLTAFRGGFRLWSLTSVQTQHADGSDTGGALFPSEWRVI